MNLLREWFKNGNFTSKAVAAAYMTGILPIKKDGFESAVSDFDEYSVLETYEFAPYAGFTEDEVKNLCQKYQMDFHKAKEWYDGYTFGNYHSVYNPYSVMQAMKRKTFKSYWRKTSTAENLETLININKDGLQEDILKLIAGEQIVVNTNRFKNDFATFTSKDDVLTLLIHLGYLVYDSENAQHTKLAKLVQASEKLLQDTLNGNETEVVILFNHKIVDRIYSLMYNVNGDEK